MAGAQGVQGAPGVDVEALPVESPGGDRLKTLGDTGLAVLEAAANKALEMFQSDPSQADPLAGYTPKQRIDIMRMGVVAGQILAKKAYPDLSSSTQKHVDIAQVARMLMQSGADRDTAAKRLAELSETVPHEKQARRELLTAAKEAESRD